MNILNIGGRDSRGKGFTLIELLAVVAILMLLLSILLPAISRAKEMSLDSRCKSNLRQTANLAVTYAQEHDSILPVGCARPPEIVNQDDLLARCFMGREVLVGTPYENSRMPGLGGWPWGNSSSKPVWGTLFPYLNSDVSAAQRLYRCIALPQGKLGSGEGSNGSFDYSMCKMFAGATLGNVPPMSYLQYPENSGIWLKKPTPYVVDESPLNTINKSYIEPGWGPGDRHGFWHFGHGNYSSLDASVSTVSSYPNKDYAPRMLDWEIVLPSGNRVSMRDTAVYGWNKR